MKVKDYISQAIHTYPLLYKDVDYEKSALKVLNHVFFVIGNGLEMASTEVPSEGGYVVEPKFKKMKGTGEYVRVMDKPYGKVKYKPLPDSYFDDVIYRVISQEPPKEVSVGRPVNVNYRFGKEVKRTDWTLPRIMEVDNTEPFFPAEAGTYSLGLDIAKQDIFLQDDWSDALIHLCEESIKCFNVEENYRTSYIYQKYPDEWEDYKKRQLSTLKTMLNILRSRKNETQ